VRIPDCPGAFGAGQTAEQAISDAVAGLAAWAAATLKDGGIAVMIPLRLDAGRTVRANLTLDAGLLAVIDVEASPWFDAVGLMASAARDRIRAV